MTKHQGPCLIGILGPTASGKTGLAEALAEKIDAKLVSADTFQAYRGLDIGTAKPENKELYHLIDILEPSEWFGVGQWIRLVLPILERCFRESKDVVIVGGTGLFFRALFEEFQNLSSQPNAELRQHFLDRLSNEGLRSLADELVKLDPVSTVALDNPVRVTRALERLHSSSKPFQFKLPQFQKLKVALNPQVDELDRSISSRLRGMIRNGFVEEVGRLIDEGVPEEAPAFRAIGYRTIIRLLRKELTGESAFASIELETRKYAKRQRTWLRSEPNLEMLNAASGVAPLEQVLALLP